MRKQDLRILKANYRSPRCAQCRNVNFGKVKRKKTLTFSGRRSHQAQESQRQNQQGKLQMHLFGKFVILKTPNKFYLDINQHPY